MNALISTFSCVGKSTFNTKNNKFFLKKMCHNPSILFDVKNRGYISEGYYADLVVFNLNKPWTVTKENLLYKCNWSPFENKSFKSRILHTFVNGNLVFSNGKVIDEYMGMKIEFER